MFAVRAELLEALLCRQIFDGNMLICGLSAGFERRHFNLQDLYVIFERSLL